MDTCASPSLQMSHAAPRLTTVRDGALMAFRALEPSLSCVSLKHDFTIKQPSIMNEARPPSLPVTDLVDKFPAGRNAVRASCSLRKASLVQVLQLPKIRPPTRVLSAHDTRPPVEGDRGTVTFHKLAVLFSK